MIYNFERNLGSTACLTATKKLMKSCLLVDFAKLITRPFCKQGLIAPNTVTLICRLFFGMRTRGCLRDQLFAFDCTLEYVVSSIHISWWGFEFIRSPNWRMKVQFWLSLFCCFSGPERHIRVLICLCFQAPAHTGSLPGQPTQHRSA